jgi:8-oxo-dGTP diphosphatase
VILLAGALGIILKDGRILLIMRGTEPFRGYWCPPGGVQEEGEPLEETVRREVEEETGVDVMVIRELGRVRGPITGNYHTLFLCSARGGSPRPSLPETTDVKWTGYEELLGLPIPPFIREFLEKLDLPGLERFATGRHLAPGG